MSTAQRPEVERADALIDLKRYKEARELLSRWLAQNPEDAHAWGLLAHCHVYGEKDPDAALEASERALAIDPEYVYGLIIRSHALRAADGRWMEAEDVLREVIRLRPDYWLGYTLLADLVFRKRLVQYSQVQGKNQLQHHEVDQLVREAADLAMQALRLGPEEVHAHEVAQLIASLAGDRTVTDELDRAILRLEPHHQHALARQTHNAASAPGVRAAQAATLYADALASAPHSSSMQRGLDAASYRLLRGVRWLALLCLAFAGVMLDLYVTEGEVQRELPLSLGQRLWFLVPAGVIWTLGALLRYRRLRAGVKINLRSVVHRRKWARVVLAQASWAMLCALLLAEVPWTERAVPQVLFWAGLLPTAATIWFDRNRNQ